MNRDCAGFGAFDFDLRFVFRRFRNVDGRGFLPIEYSIEYANYFSIRVRLCYEISSFLKL